MTSRSKNVNLNKEPFEGYVRHWKRQWVQYGDRAKEDKGAWTLRLVKWVQTESRVSSGPARHPHISPVTDLSLVPGARLGDETAATAANGASFTAAFAGQPAPAAPQAQQEQGDAAAAAAAAAAAQAAAYQAAYMQQPYQQQLQPLAAPTAAAAAAAAAGMSAFAGGAAAQAAGDLQGQLPRATSLNALSLEMPSSQQDAAAAAAAAGAGPSSFALPSPSVVTGGAFSYGQPPGSQLQLQTTGSDFAVYAAGAPSAGGAATASGYTAGTERTDSDALGRLPHAGGPAASEYTDSMDVDIDMGGASQGGVSQRQPGAGGVSIVSGGDDLDDMDDDGDDDGDDEGEEGLDEEDGEGEGVDAVDAEDSEEDDEGEEEEGEDADDQGYEDDGLGGVDDMP